MPTPTAIPVDKLARLVGTPACPVVVDVRPDDAFRDDSRLIPGSIRRPVADIAHWSADLAGRGAVAVCRHGRDIGHGAAAYLRQAGVAAETLDGGFDAWEAAGLPLVPEAKLPPRDARGRTVWVTRARPKVDRIACPWLIRRFVDPDAVFLFVPPPEVNAVAERFGGAPFDIDDPGAFWSHRGTLCTFDVMVEELGLAMPPLLHLATLVRGADTARPDLAPEAAGLLAASLGLSRIYADDLEQLDAGMLLYDAFYRWCRDATEETHNWPTNKPKARA
ncbi:sulfurtransferase/chromate resistance protein [Methylobacterium sp. NEAU K]|uniref:sulfurtransferase/chromate resistance protein n=1 Tax=Methylobacterium sp. NEAU K TaxID=3064946 RepID=UPI0027371975|nr:sulfurtransferase/chromate resistance protein [Methylobacterium sp. NEAU K]MDP4003285.1 sulfurtransferase/chromate resistance protein [Methylobacterium sp. NEAU K]